MVVRFDNKAVQQTVEHKAEPIGVDGDLSTKRLGGISEADAIVKEARKSMGEGTGKMLHSDVKSEEGVEEEKARISHIIREEEEKEVGPELDPGGLKHVPKMHQNS